VATPVGVAEAQLPNNETNQVFPTALAGYRRAKICHRRALPVAFFEMNHSLIQRGQILNLQG
jgi:hypothetical protein